MAVSRSGWARAEQLSIVAAIALQGSLALQFSPLETMQFSQVRNATADTSLMLLSGPAYSGFEWLKDDCMLGCLAGLVLRRSTRHWQTVSWAKESEHQHGSNTHKGGSIPSFLLQTAQAANECLTVPIIDDMSDLNIMHPNCQDSSL